MRNIFNGCTLKRFEISYDPAKCAANVAAGRPSSDEVAEFDFRTAVFAVDDRYDYGEIRHRAFGFLNGRLHALVFVMKKQLGPDEPDDENPEWTAETFKRSVPFSGLPESLQAKLRGRPRIAAPKVAVKLRLDQDLLAAMRATGRGWQTRINAILRERFVR